MKLNVPLAISKLGSNCAELGRGEGEKSREACHESTTLEPMVVPEGSTLSVPNLAFGSLDNPTQGGPETSPDGCVPVLWRPGDFLVTI